MSSGVGQSTPVASPTRTTVISQPPTTLSSSPDLSPSPSPIMSTPSPTPTVTPTPTPTPIPSPSPSPSVTPSISSPPPVSTTTPPSTTTTSSSTVIIDTTTTPTTTTPDRTTTPPSNPTTTPTTDATPTTTSRNQGGTTTTTPTPTISTSTLVFSTVIVTTDQNGQVGTQTVRSTQIVFPTNTPTSSGSTSSNVGAIAGGVVGGAVGVLALILVIFFCLKRRKPRDDNFDGNFDPDRLDPERFGGSATRPGPLPNVDLVGAEVVTPFNYHADPAPQKGYDPYAQMAQRPEMPVPVVSGPTSAHGRSDIHSSTTGSHYPTTITEQSVSGMHHQDWRGPSPGPSLATSGTLPSSKDREHANGGSRFQVSNNAEGGSGQGGGNAVLQHRDGGRLQQPSVPEEIPPSYDSISPDERNAAGPSS